jgi:hypothetical protein
MKQTSFMIVTFLLMEAFALSHAGTPPGLTLEDIFSKANSIRFLSYDTKVTSPFKRVGNFKIWIHGDDIYVSKLLGGIKQVGGKSYIFQNDKWIEWQGLTINTAIRFLKEAERAEDTRIIGEESLDGKQTTVIEYTQPGPEWGSEIRIKLWVSNKTCIPLKIREHNITQKKIQTHEITNISFEENDYQAFFREIEETKERKRRAKEEPKPWHPESEQKYSELLQIDEQEDLTAKQKIDAWETFLKTISENDPSTRRDDQMRFKAGVRICYWKYASRFHFSTNGIIQDAQTGLEWLVGPDRDTSWEEARSWVAGLMIDGGGWRMPTINELKNAHERSPFGPFRPPFYPKTGWLLWSGESIRKVGGWYFDYTYSRKYSSSNKVSKNLRAVAVRDSK